MSTEISLFSQKSFITASKKFVCVRLGTYESIENQSLIRSLLNGRMENTAFVVFAPDGKTRLTRSGRSPKHAFGNDVIPSMNALAAKYKPTASVNQSLLTDYHSFKQALNAASADQRLLVFTVSPNAQLPTAKANLQTVFNDPSITGRFFYDIAEKLDTEWAKSINNATKKTGIFIIQSGKYGQTGTALAELPLDATPDTIKQALLAANAAFAKTEKRKVYSQHVADGRKDNINYLNNVAPGEDRNADGKIDPKPQRGQKGQRKPAFEPEAPSNNPSGPGLDGFPGRQNNSPLLYLEQY
ncbi:MAG: hypothetical protein ACSHX6_13390 [Akkermansiaceae bacterium]